MSILVTGGAGFIGSNVNKLLHLHGFETIILDNLTQGDRRACKGGTFIEGDLGDAKLLSQIFCNNNIAGVMHFGAYINVGESVVKPAEYYENNFVKTLTLINSMVKHNINHLVFSSSAAVYGLPETATIKEDHVCLPINPYGETKLMIEKALLDYEKAYGLRSVALRYFNASGGDPEGEIKNYQKKDLNLIPIVLRNIIKKQPVSVFGTDYPTPDGTCIRDYIHVYDLGTAHLLALEHLMAGRTSSHFNLGNGVGASVKEVIEAAFNVTGKKVPIKEVHRREGDPSILIADPTKAMTELGWKPKFGDLEMMIDHAWKAMLH
jgi:UDP-glucose 4-epimerase